jgi:hypothetical protein
MLNPEFRFLFQTLSIWGKELLNKKQDAASRKLGVMLHFIYKQNTLHIHCTHPACIDQFKIILSPAIPIRFPVHKEK